MKEGSRPNVQAEGWQKARMVTEGDIPRGL
jgi:hypothetical protein